MPQGRIPVQTVTPMTDARVPSVEETATHLTTLIYGPHSLLSDAAKWTEMEQTMTNILHQQREAGRAEGEALVRKALAFERTNPTRVTLRFSGGFGWMLNKESVRPAQWWALTGEGERPKETE